MVLLEEHEISGLPTIPEFYRGKTILITGGTGFLGKLLVEKLLYSCPDLKQIYLFIRDKRGVGPEKRLAAIYNNNSCFERLRKERDGTFQTKVKAISGNMLSINLGMSEEDRELVTKTTDVLIHSAASVRFDDSLEDAFKINVMATLQLIELAKQMNNLKCYVHISTSFCNIEFGKAIEEKIYPPKADWRTIKEICEKEDSNTLKTLTSKLMGEYPNTYVFTKHLAEQAVGELRGQLPIIIVRPSVVSGCIKEPVPGWVDNFNGPVGIAMACAQGILRVLYGDIEASQDYVPGDVVIKGIVTASWIRGTKKLEAHDDIAVYNACAGADDRTQLDYIRTRGYEVMPLVALENTIRPINLSIIRWIFLYRIYVLVTHVWPAIAVDLVFRLLGKKPMLLKLQRKVISANLALELFVTRSWCFSNEKFMGLRSKLNPLDRRHFSFTLDAIHTNEYLLDLGLRARKDLLHQDEKSLKKWRKIYQWELIIDKMVKFIFYTCALWWIVKRFVNSFVEA